MKKIFTFFIIFSFLTSCSNKSKFIGTWYNNSNFCDSLSISKGENNLVAEYFGFKFPAEVNDGYLEIFGEEITKVSLGKKDELLINGTVYSKKIIDENLLLDGDWKIHECTKKYEWSKISLTKDTIVISYGSPIEIIGTIKRLSIDTIAVNYEYVASTIHMSKLIDELEDKINYDKPIAYILPISKNHFSFKWLGITLKNEKEKYLDKLDDDLYWGEKANDFEYKLIFIKE